MYAMRSISLNDGQNEYDSRDDDDFYDDDDDDFYDDDDDDCSWCACAGY